MKPNYLVIGAQKCATSSLCDLIGRHPDAFMTDPKEPYFFSHDDVWSKGWEWYESLFAAATRERAVGEGSTTYTQQHLYPHAAERIRMHLPDAKLIYIVRDPLERIRSHWLHLRRTRNREPLPFNEAVKSRPEYIDNSSYMKQLDVYRAHSPDASILVLFFEDFRADPYRVLSTVYSFLGIDATFRPPNAEEPQYVSARSRVDRPVASMIRRLPGFQLLRANAPGWLRSPWRTVLRKPIDARPEWDAATRQWAIDRLRDDLRAFLARYADGRTLWSWIDSDGDEEHSND